LTEDQKERLQDALKDTQDWLDKNQSADREDYEEELRELEKYKILLIHRTCNPIIQEANKKKEGDDDDDDADSDL
jgi:endoplasmic reticulum chaperone BiP